uniref:Zgc:194209 n=1 Tax=Hippocampus comes TaxID=109280 RepID=A0A3Q3D4L0_HIPCM
DEQPAAEPCLPSTPLSPARITHQARPRLAKAAHTQKSAITPSETWRGRSVCVVILALAVGLYLLPSPIDPKPHVLPGPPPALEGPLAANTRLQKGHRLFEGKLHGPESFDADKEGERKTFAPLCLYLLVSPPRPVLTKSNVPLCVFVQGTCTQGRWTGSCGADGVPFAFLNGLEISSQTGIIYFTDSSSRWGRRHVKLEVMELNRLGRLLSYEPETGRVSVLLDSLYMANGLALDPNGRFLLVAETSVARILKYWLRGPKTGMAETVLDNMIGYPDNIRVSRRGTFLVGITTPRLRSFLPPFLDALAPYPAVKRFLAKVVPLSWYEVLLPRYALVLELDADGRPVGSMHDPEGRLTWAISDVFQHGGRTFLGNTNLPFLPVVTLDS